CRDEVRNPPYVIDVNMGHYEGDDVGDVKVDGLASNLLVGRPVVALEQAAVDQYRRRRIDLQAVAATRHTAHRAMVSDRRIPELWVDHRTVSHQPVLMRGRRLHGTWISVPTRKAPRCSRPAGRKPCRWRGS